MFSCNISNNLLLEDINVVFVEIMPPNQRTVGHDCDSVLLGKVDQSVLREVRMQLDLQGYRLDFAICKKVHDGLTIEVGYSQMPDISLRDTKLELFPELFNRFVVSFP